MKIVIDAYLELGVIKEFKILDEDEGDDVY